VAAVYMLSDRNAGAVFDPLDQKKVDCFFFLSWLLIYYSASDMESK
jgi:hypothetical protein